MDEPTQTMICSVSVDMSVEDWEVLYQAWQQENVESFVAEYGERVGTIHVTREPEDPSLPNHAIFTVYADLNPGE
jgi:hypothetical protein